MRIICYLSVVAAMAWAQSSTLADSAVDSPIEKPTRTQLSGVPWEPSPAPAQPKVVYGADDRIDLYQETNAARRNWAASTCGLLNSSSVRSNGDGTFDLVTNSYNVCSDEPFSNQPTAPFCSGFMVGDDIIATAGHCFDSGDLGRVRFVFGYVMEDENTPVLTVEGDQVYTGVEVLGRALSGGLDYAVVRVDRTITAPGAVPFELRRDGVVPIGANVGVIGHPSGLPLKLAFGNNTVVRANGDTGFFVANLDTYGGNSGSPVINPATGLIEGILVRGETDFVTVGGCRRSNVVGNDGGRGEDVSKSLTFMELVPELGSTLRLDRDAYACGGTVTATVSDPDEAGSGTLQVLVTSSLGDSEALSLTEAGASGSFTGSLALSVDTVLVDNGQLEIETDASITVVYEDGVHSGGAPDQLIANADVDCIAPVLGGVDVGQVGTTFALVNFSSDEPTSGTVYYGTTCGGATQAASFIADTNHTVTLQGLASDRSYFFYVEAMDAAGNEAVADNGGTCFTFRTTLTSNYNTERYSAAVPDLVNKSLLFTPEESTLGFALCQASITALPWSTLGANFVALDDDGFVRVTLASAKVFPFFGTDYSGFYINANGNITFNAGDQNYAPDLSVHFQNPRISALFSDLNPEAGGSISYNQLSDRVVVTWSNVPHYVNLGTNTVQLELYFDGKIRISYRGLSAFPVVVGLSAGQGLQSDYGNTDLSEQALCETQSPVYHSADSNENGVIELQELMRVIQFVNVGAYHCDELGEDGYNAGAGIQDCEPHDSDYSPQDWVISLSEVLRLVQFFNGGGYLHLPGPDSEDGFATLSAR